MENKRKDENEGEGSKTADKKYRDEVESFEEQHDVEVLGRAAEREVEADPEEYRKAEAEGKKHAAGEDPELYRKGFRDDEKGFKKDG